MYANLGMYRPLATPFVVPAQSNELGIAASRLRKRGQLWAAFTVAGVFGFLGCYTYGFDLPEVVITAPKLELGLQALPASATVADSDFLGDTAVRTVKDAAFYAPNTFFNEFSVRAVSNARFRGVGGSPTNPAVTTYFDGVPQFNAYSSSITLLDVEQVDFLRGPVGALFGRNSVGGLIHVASRRPSLTTLEGEAEATYGSYGLFEERARVSIPLIKDTLSLSIAGGDSQRDGYTKNSATGKDLDSRSGWFGKAQVLWQIDPDLEVRFLISGEEDRDGDYALGLLSKLRQNPRLVTRDYEGFTHRDLLTPTLQVKSHGHSVDFTSTTGLVWWKTQDRTVVDYGSGMLGPTRGSEDNREKQTAWTQEFRFANPVKEPISLGNNAELSWQAGVFGFKQDYDQSATYLTDLTYVNLFDPSTPSSLRSASNSQFQDWGGGCYVQSTLRLFQKWDLAAGLRFDHESKTADMVTNDTAYYGALGPFQTPLSLHSTRDYDRLTPQASLTFLSREYASTYFAFSSGYKAGGFNTGARTSSGAPVSYKEETSRTYELGLKGNSASSSLRYDLAVFYTDWQQLQLNIPSYRYGVTNAGDAQAFGVEGSVKYRLTQNWEVFGSAGWEQTRFLAGSREGTTNIAGNRLPTVPQHTAALGTQVTIDVGSGWQTYARAEVQNTGGLKYDPVNGDGQDSYSTVNMRVGIKNKRVFIEGYANNAFNEKYVPLAFKNPVNSTEYIGESGAPATFGMRVGVKF